MLRKAIVVVIIGLFIGTNASHDISAKTLKNNNIFEKTISDIKNIDKQNTINNKPNEQWNKTFGSSGYNEGWCVQETDDKGYIIVGTTAPLYYNFDIWLLKTDKYGIEEWNRTFGGEGSDYANSVRQTRDGGYIIVGLLWLTDDKQWDIWLIKTDNFGNEEWNRTFGGDLNDFGWCVQQTFDDGYIITGFTEVISYENRDVILIKTDVNGNEEWNKTYGESMFDEGQYVIQTNDGGYIITGYIMQQEGFLPSFDIWLIKTNSTGYIEWDKIFTGFFNVGTCVQQTRDGGYIITGYIGGFEGSDLLLIKTDSEGNIIWDTKFGGKGEDWARSVKQTNDGGYIIAGQTSSYGAGNLDVWLIKTDKDGDKKWESTFGGIENDTGQSVQLTSDGGYIIAGTTSSYGSGRTDIWLIKTDKNGKGKNRTDIDTPLLRFLQQHPSFDKLFQRFLKI